MTRTHAGTTCIWYCRFDRRASTTARLGACLSADEVRQAGRYRFPDDARRFVQRRGFLRHLLARYAGVAPKAIACEYDQNGKPRLARALAATVAFNLSSSQHAALIAVSPDGAIGTDIETLRPVAYLDELMNSVFLPSERARVRMASDTRQRLAAFLRVWTAKEACVKATGIGVSALRETEIRTESEEGSWVGFCGSTRFAVRTFALERYDVAAVACRPGTDLRLLSVTAAQVAHERLSAGRWSSAWARAS